MNEDTDLANEAAEVIAAARAAEHAIQHLRRTTLTRPNMTPAQVDIVLAHLAAAAAALPQAARQVGDILAQTEEDHLLEMDNLTEINNPDLAIDTARLHLDGAGEAALSLYRQLDAKRGLGVAPRVHRSEDRRPPTGAGGTGRGLPR